MPYCSSSNSKASTSTTTGTVTPNNTAVNSTILSYVGRPPFPDFAFVAATRNNSVWGRNAMPTPTNAWFNGLVVIGDAPDYKNYNWIFPLPYGVRATAKGLAISYPYPVVRQFSSNCSTNSDGVKSCSCAQREDKTYDLTKCDEDAVGIDAQTPQNIPQPAHTHGGRWGFSQMG